MNKDQFKLPLLIIAAISGTLNFGGFSVVVDTTWWALSLAALTSIGVFVALYAFWDTAFTILPSLEKPGHRVAGWTVVGVACGLILSLSTYWNAVALAGKELERLAGGDVTIRVERQLAEAGEKANSYQSLTPLVSRLDAQIKSLRDGELENGAISGKPGAGSFTRLLDQIGGRVTATDNALSDAGHAVQKQISEGQNCLTQSTTGAAVSCANRTIAALNQQKVAEQVKQSMSALTAGVTLPVTLKSKGQRHLAKGIIADIQTQADEIAHAAQAVDTTPVEFASAERPNVLQSVLLYWPSIIPALATAIALDLLPLVLLVLATMRSRDLKAQNKSSDPTTVEELTRASDAAKHLRTLFK